MVADQVSLGSGQVVALVADTTTKAQVLGSRPFKVWITVAAAQGEC
jgi:hypothetical protein